MLFLFFSYSSHCFFNHKEYALVFDKLINLLKGVNDNFFILPAGFDQAAAKTAETLNETAFLKIMAQTAIILSGLHQVRIRVKVNTLFPRYGIKRENF